MSDLLLFSIRLLGLLAVLVTAGYFLSAKPRTSVSYLAIGVCLGIFSYLVVSGSFISIDADFRLPLGVARVPLLVLAASTPWLLMLLSQHLFADKRSLPMWAVFLFALQLGLDIISANTINWNCQTANCLTYPRDRFSVSEAAYHTLPTLLKGLFCFIAFIWAVKDWGPDLIRSRRFSRQLFIVVLAILGGGIVVAEDFTLAISGIVQFFPLVSAIDTVLVSVFFILVAGYLLGYRGQAVIGDLVAPEPDPDAVVLPAAKTNGAENKDLQALQAALNDGVYRQAGLNLSRMAENLGLPNYRLRQLIHRNYGFRHFTTFLNHFRLREACEQLRAPANQDRTILDIALGVGFGSITSFNHAFKQTLGTTPSAYRAQCLDKSSKN